MGTFPVVTEVCDADSRSKYGTELAEKYTVLFIAECYEEVFGKEESNVQKSVNAAWRGCIVCSNLFSGNCRDCGICLVRGGEIDGNNSKDDIITFY